MKKYGFILMLLVGLLIPMTIASKSIDFDLNTILFDEQEIFISVDSLESMQPLKIKSMITKEGAEDIRKRSDIESKVVIITTYPPSRDSPIMVDGRPKTYRVVRYQSDLIDIQKYAITNYIRYL